MQTLQKIYIFAVLILALLIPQAFSAEYPVPEEYFVLASTYGPRILSDDYDFHTGLDFQAPEETPIYAVEDGEVVRSMFADEDHVLKRYGEFVVIKHAGTTQSAYLHMFERLVEEGDIVEAGDQIGSVGDTGYQINTVHLHFEYYEDLDNGNI